MSDKGMTIHLKIWRQASGATDGKFHEYTVNDVAVEMSFLEMLDILNEDLVKKGEEAIEFDNDCREGICGTCGMVVSGVAHGKHAATTTCEIRMRSYKDGEEWKSSDSYWTEHLLLLSKVADLAHTTILTELRK